MTTPGIVVVRRINRVLVGAPGPQGPPGPAGEGGGVSVPDGVYPFATVTVEGETITDIEAGEDVASEETQQEILVAVNDVATQVSLLSTGGVTGAGHSQETNF